MGLVDTTVGPAPSSLESRQEFNRPIKVSRLTMLILDKNRLPQAGMRKDGLKSDLVDPFYLPPSTENTAGRTMCLPGQILLPVSYWGENAQEMHLMSIQLGSETSWRYSLREQYAQNRLSRLQCLWLPASGNWET